MYDIILADQVKQEFEKAKGFYTISGNYHATDSVICRQRVHKTVENEWTRAIH